MMELAGKTGIITGGSSGLGFAAANVLAEAGAVVYAVSRSGRPKLEGETSHENVIHLAADVSDYKEMGELTERIGREHGIDFLVNNAGITRDNLLMKMSEEDFDAVIQTNLKGVFNCVKHVSRQMLKQKSGRIINISSVSGVLGNAGQANYCAAKAGVIGITKSAARELASREITVNAVAPGFIATEMTDVLSDSVKAAATEQIPMKHFGSTQDIAETVAFLASDKAGYITGQVLSVDGGMAM